MYPCKAALYMKRKEQNMSIYETKGGFLSVFLPLATLIFFGIIYEDVLVRYEQRVLKKIRKAIRQWKKKESA